MQKAFIADKIFTGTEWLTDHTIIINDYSIDKLLPSAELPSDLDITKRKGTIVPAFIDLQIYGAYNKLLAVDPVPQTLHLINEYCRKGGAVLFLPTVATNTPEVFYKCIDSVRQYWDSGGKGVWGLHVEGPWLNPEKRGAHIENLIHSPGMEEVEELLQYGKGIIKMITLAPEMCNGEIIRLIEQHGIVVSAGHSNATYEEALNSFDKGITTVTHLYNAMSGLQHRAPGLVGACFNHAHVKASIIADGHHVDFAAITIAKKIMGERLFVITDAVAETGEGYYQHKLAGDKYECNGVLSGSALTMHKSFINLVQKAGIEIGEALRMCSLYPAHVLGCAHEYGRIAAGYSKQFLLLNNEWEIAEIFT